MKAYLCLSLLTADCRKYSQEEVYFHHASLNQQTCMRTESGHLVLTLQCSCTCRVQNFKKSLFMRWRVRSMIRGGKTFHRQMTANQPESSQQIYSQTAQFVSSRYISATGCLEFVDPTSTRFTFEILTVVTVLITR